MTKRITIVTCKDYDKPKVINPYIQNILDEYQYIKDALVAQKITVERTFWDNPNYDWDKTDAVIIRTTWDYFKRFDAFYKWLVKVDKKTTLINPLPLIQWNIDKRYLYDLKKKGIRIVPTEFIDIDKSITLKTICKKRGWKTVVIKPAISAGAFHTYKVEPSQIETQEALFKALVNERVMLVQEYQNTITTLGEASLMVFNGKYSHAILKQSKGNDFRVQDDFGGTVHEYHPTKEEIDFAERVFKCCNPSPAYGRVDIIWDGKGNHYLSELEIIEPEIWIRNYPASAKYFVEGVLALL